MSSDGSVTHWLALFRAGDRSAAQPLWERYFPALVARARVALGTASRRVADEEDAALSAFDSFCRGVVQGRFPFLGDRTDLWRLLLTITVRKATHHLRDAARAKRGGGTVVCETDLTGDDDDALMLANVLGSEPTPELAAQLAEACRRLLDKLGDDTLRQIAVWRMEGYTVEEIAAKLGVAPRTVERKLALIREIWGQEDPRP